MPGLLKISLTLLIITILLLGFAVPVNPPNGTWYQQFFPNLQGARIVDITFTDSLTGYALTNLSSNGTAYVLKSTNSGNNWFTCLTDTNESQSFDFINSNTGFIARGFVDGTDLLYKTTNGGINWTTLIMPEEGIAMDVEALGADTLWVADPAPLDIGGIYRTTNSGASWQRTYAGFNNNPQRIYMYNGRIGFMYTSTAGPLWKTTNGGFNWFTVPTGVFRDIYFIDSLKGWKSEYNTGNFQKTTNGGLNWITQTLPYGGIIFSTGISEFSVLSEDTIWGSGGIVSNGGVHRRAILYKTINGGVNWLFQVPDTSFGIGIFLSVQFLNQRIGWGYGIKANSSSEFRNIHTTNGGDTTFLLGLQQLSTEVPKEFKLFQNYPNPFNPKTNIKYQIVNNNSNVILTVYDITGKHIIDLVNHKQNAGTYEVDFTGDGYSSGVYFYSLIVDGKRINTKKMILIK